ncbi:putative protoporphyrinogen oxidase [Aspergillus steynii IBT 23096]|uniref:Protoporphyrinogen oxidase n=1 Tax=Aspergillus steynii IBT 23096 TaxID=1392250 RepID=A0A2I2GRB0_9EURO|nr:putative protoporphyrinogen oxidase [Aspergillus steynii IBT 23096]PLB55384.1 putative protoporphyrinogen oxidase [Aspergillus steynii IBT 23096]
MRLPGASSRALKGVRPPLALFRDAPRRSLHTPTYDAAVIGGGITGLTTAYRLSKDPKCSKITLYEKSSHLGGWLQSEKIPFKDGHVVFEYGPRTLRTVLPSCLPLLDLLADLDLLDDVLITRKSSPAALNRYVYYPDHLVRLPAPHPSRNVLGNIWSILRTLLTEPVFKTLFQGLYNDLNPEGPQTLKSDESIADFVSRRFTPELADNLVSAVVHGIYAGNIDRLSADAIIPFREQIPSTPFGFSVLGSVLWDLRQGNRRLVVDDHLALHAILQGKPQSYLKDLRNLIRGSSVLTLRNGLHQLSDALLTALTKSKKVDFLPETEVTAVNRNAGSSNITITPGRGESRMHNRVVSTIPAPHIARALRQTDGNGRGLPQNTIQSLEEHNYAVTVMVVNLFYENKDLLPVRGFGYLIPRSIPFEQNPERGLGVIFGTEASVGQDTVAGTKLTVMMGGHLWDGWKESDYPDHDTAVDMARSLLERHLGITDAPAISRTRLHRDAIPQYTVGHMDRMRTLSDSARQEFNNRLTFAGSWYGGVGVVDCIRQAYLAASYGVGAQKLRPDSTVQPWKSLDYMSWDLEGGIVTSPIRRTKIARPPA